MPDQRMTDEDANHLRCLCHEIIINLWSAGKTESLKLLQTHISRCFEVTPEQALEQAGEQP